MMSPYGSDGECSEDCHEMEVDLDEYRDECELEVDFDEREDECEAAGEMEYSERCTGCGVAEVVLQCEGEECANRLCLRCSSSEISLCSQCAGRQMTLANEHDSALARRRGSRCDECGDIAFSGRCGYGRNGLGDGPPCTTMLSLCGLHRSSCVAQNRFHDRRAVSALQCTPPLLCAAHNGYCICTGDCVSCGRKTGETCTVCNGRVCVACSVMITDLEGQFDSGLMLATRKMCKSHGEYCGLCRRTTYDFHQRLCEHRRGAVTCNTVICPHGPLKHKIFGNFCADHTVRCGRIDAAVPSWTKTWYDGPYSTKRTVFASAGGCGARVPVMYSREIQLRSFARRYDYCLECFDKLRGIFELFLILRRRGFYFPADIIERLFMFTVPETLEDEPRSPDFEGARWEIEGLRKVGRADHRHAW